MKRTPEELIEFERTQRKAEERKRLKDDAFQQEEENE